MSDLRTAKTEAVDRFLNRFDDARPRSISLRPEHNVIGVGIGSRIRNGKLQCDQTIRLYVSVKVRDRKLIPTRQLLPPEIAGVPTDVVAIGSVLPASGRPSPITSGPPQPGMSIGVTRPCTLLSGTLAAIVDYRGRPHLLTGNHVVADNDPALLGRVVLHPGPSDGPGRQIGLLRRFVPITRGELSEVDAAIAELTVSADPAVLPPVGRLADGVPADPVEMMAVEKVGAGTGHTTGTIFDISADLSTKYAFGPVTLHNQILIRGAGRTFAFSSDSGSLIVARDTKRAVGLLCAYAYDGDKGFYGVANHLNKVLSALDVTLVA